MTDLSERVAVWEELMGGGFDPDPNSLQFVRDDRVVELTAQYINKLKTIQDGHNSDSAHFESRIRERVSEEELDLQHIEDICRRFLAGIEMTFLEEIPDSVPVSETNNLKTLEIDWTADPVSARWIEVDVCFSLLPALFFCAEHSAGADEGIREVLVDQLVSDLQGGVATIGLALQSHDESMSVFHWSPAFVTLDEPSEDLPTPADEADYAIGLETYLRDRELRMVARVHEHAAERSQLIQQANVAAMLAFDDMPEPDQNDPIHERVQFVINDYPATAQERALDAMASSAMTRLIAAQAMGDLTLFNQVSPVLKSIKRVKRSQAEFETA